MTTTASAPTASAPTSSRTGDRRRVQRRTVAVLMVGEVLGAVAMTVGFSVVGILAAELADSTGAVGVTQASQTIGTAVAAYIVAAWMNAHGRRNGLATGYLVAAAGAALCVGAAATQSFLMLIAGSVALGSASAAGSLSRYAATDLAAPDRRATALSLVVWTGTAGAVAGPLLVPTAESVAEQLALPSLAGPFLFAMVSTTAAAAVLFVFLRPDPLLVAREMAASTPDADEGPGARVVAPVRELVPVIAALVLTHVTMVVVMVLTPVAMHHGGSSHEAIGAAISFHFLGMFAFAPLSGMLADRWGVRPALVVGAAVLAVSLALLVGVVGETSTAHAGGMFALGLGWSVCTVAATAHLAACSTGDTRIQGITETTMSFLSAGAAAGSGPIMAVWGFDGLIALAGLLVLALLGCIPRIAPVATTSARAKEE